MKVTYLCPLAHDVCFWDGDKNEILNHFEEVHPESLVYTNIVPIDVTEEGNTNVLMYYLKRIYLVQLKLDNARHLSVALRYLGSFDEAAAHNYTIQVVCGNFSFSHINSSFISSNKGLVEVDVSSIAMMTDNTTLKNFQLCVMFEHMPKYTKEGMFLEKINEDFGEELDHGKKIKEDVLLERIIEDFGESLAEEEENMLETKNALMNDVDDLLVDEKRSNTFQRRNSRRKSSGTYSMRRRSSTIDLDEDKAKDLDPEENHQEEVALKTNSLLESVKCFFCNLNIALQIYTCQFKHNACILCKTNNCRICDTEFQRNKYLEELSKHLTYPCRFQALCGFTSLAYNEILSHEVTCIYSMYNCPFCPFLCNHGEIERHLKQCIDVRIYNQLTNPFPQNSTFAIINGTSGVFMCTSLNHNNMIEYKVKFCGQLKIYVQCDVVFMGKMEYRYKMYRDGNNLTTMIAMAELKSKVLKAKNALLVISTKPTDY